MNTVHDYEIEWMMHKRPLTFDKHQLLVDYGEHEAKEIIESFEKQKMQEYMGCLNWHGVGSRWKHFLEWLVKQDAELLHKRDLKDVFTRFAHHLGRVTSFRALSLTPDGFATILRANAVYPSGRLKVDEASINKFVLEYGVKKICYARLFIGLGLMQFDPSLSLHDDGETAVCIASSYATKDKKIHLMKLSVPKIEVVGYKLSEISKDSQRWFQHNHIWFDGDDERTERYTLYEIPFYKERLQELIIFDTSTKVNQYLSPFQLSQKEKYQKSLDIK